MYDRIVGVNLALFSFAVNSTWQSAASAHRCEREPDSDNPVSQDLARCLCEDSTSDHSGVTNIRAKPDCPESFTCDSRMAGWHTRRLFAVAAIDFFCEGGRQNRPSSDFD